MPWALGERLFGVFGICLGFHRGKVFCLDFFNLVFLFF